MLRRLIVICLFIFSAQNIAFAQVSNDENGKSSLPIMSGVGGDFTGIGSNGKAFTFSDYYKDNIVLLFFGYTNCADVCPFTLGYLKQVYEQLSPAEQAEVQIVFVTIDPEYDTPEHLDGFVNFFNEDFIGVTGSQAQINDIVALFQANYYKLSEGKVNTKNIRRVNEKEDIDKETDTGDLYSHTVNVYLIDTNGNTRSLDFTGTDHPIMLSKIRSLLTEKNGGRTTATVANNTQSTGNTSTNAVKLQTEGEFISVQDHYVPAAPPNTRVMAGFGKIVNNGEEAVYLVDMSSTQFGKVELHATEVINGSAQMVKQENTLIDKADFLVMEPGSYHLMLMQPKAPLKKGEIVTISFDFKSADSGEEFSEVFDFPIK